MVGSTWHCGARNCRITIDDLRAQLQSINRRPGPHVVPLCCCAMRPRASFVPKLGLYCSAKVLYASRVPPRSLGEINEPTLQLPVAVGLPVVLVSLARRLRQLAVELQLQLALGRPMLSNVGSEIVGIRGCASTLSFKFVAIAGGAVCWQCCLHACPASATGPPRAALALVVRADLTQASS